MRPQLALAFTLSGFASLIEEVLWIRLLGDVFGHTALALHVVLAVFFGGVATGGLLTDPPVPIIRETASPGRLV